MISPYLFVDHPTYSILKLLSDGAALRMELARDGSHELSACVAGTWSADHAPCVPRITPYSAATYGWLEPLDDEHPDLRLTAAAQALLGLPFKEIPSASAIDLLLLAMADGMPVEEMPVKHRLPVKASKQSRPAPCGKFGDYWRALAISPDEWRRCFEKGLVIEIPSRNARPAGRAYRLSSAGRAQAKK